MTDHLPFVTKTAAGITFVTGTNLILSSGTLAVVNSPDFPGNLVVGQSASINQDVLFSGSISLVAGSGIAFDGRTISNTAASASIAGVAQINGQTGTVLLNAGPGMSINTAGGTINVVNAGTITPGVNVILNSGTLSVPLSAGPGLNFSSGTFTNIATLVPGVNVLISSGSIGVPLYAGNGISFANATITNAGVISVQGFTGNVSLVGGTGIDIVSNTVINTGVTAINGQTGSLVAVSTLTSGAGISVSYVSGTTIVANAGVLSFNNATGNVTGVSSVNGQTDAVILESGSGILVGAASGGTIPINNNGVLTVQGLSGNVSLVAGSGIDIASNTIINTGQSTPLSAGDNINISGGSIGVVPNPYFSGSVTASILTGQVLDIIGDAGAGTLAFGWADFGTIPSQNVVGLEWDVGSGSIGYYMQIYDGAVNSQGTVLIRQWGPLNYTVYPQFTPNGGMDIPTQYLSGLTTGGGTLAVTGQSSSGTVSAYEVLSPSNTLSLAVTSSTVSATVTSATISIINSGTQSGTLFQQVLLVNFNDGNLSSYANDNLTNIQFSDLSGATIIPSWRASGTSPNGTAIYWLKFNDGIPGSSTVYVMMNFFGKSTTVLNTTNTGAASNLYSPYGVYETGSLIFDTFYTAFGGTILPSIWSSTVATGGTITVNNGLSVVSVSTAWTYVNATLALNPSQYAMDFSAFFDPVATTGQAIGWQNGLVAPQIELSNSSPYYTLNNYNGSSSHVDIVNGSNITTPQIWDLYATATQSVLSLNWSSTVSLATDLTISSTVGLFFGVSAVDPLVANWVAVRRAAPGYIMPNQSISTLPALPEPTVVFPVNARFINGPTTGAGNWSNIASRPYLVVSPVGTTNVSTITIQNNGADLGPDTVVNGTLTTTYGILEGINTATINGNVHLYLLSGTYDLTNAPLQPYISGVSSGAHLVLPYVNMTTSPIISITIEGQNSVWNQSELTGSFSQPAKNGVVIISTLTAATVGGNANNYPILGAYYNLSASSESERISGVDFTLKHITFNTLSGTGISGVDLQAVTSLTTDNVVVGVASEWPLAQPTGTQVGFKCPVSYTNKIYIGALWIYGYYEGIVLGTHADIGMLWVFSNISAITNIHWLVLTRFTPCFPVRRIADHICHYNFHHFLSSMALTAISISLYACGTMIPLWYFRIISFMDFPNTLTALSMISACFIMSGNRPSTGSMYFSTYFWYSL